MKKSLYFAPFLAASLVVPAAPLTQAARKPPAAPQSHSGKTITLVTGDRVHVRNGAVTGIDPGPGRDHIAFQRFGTGHDLSVLPSDAVQRRLDPRLFRIGAAEPVRHTAATDHGLKVEALDRKGESLAAYATVVSRSDPGFGTWSVKTGEELRVPPGKYAVHVLGGGPKRGGGPFLELMAPEVHQGGARRCRRAR